METEDCTQCVDSIGKELALKYYKIIVSHPEGMSFYQISEKLNANKGQIPKIVNQFHEHQDVLVDLRSNNGRSIQFEQDTLEFVNQLIQSTQNRMIINLKFIQEELLRVKKKEVSQQTILNHINKIGRFKQPYIVPVLSLKNQEKRMEFCEYHQRDLFSNVFFTDESSFQIFTNNSKVFQLFEEKTYQKPKPNHNYSILVWGCICRKKKLALEILEGTIDSEKYIGLLSKHIAHQGNTIYGKQNWRFQQDNAPAHKSYKTKEWLKDNMPRLIQHPPQIPDLNTVELSWERMNNVIEKQQPKTKLEFEGLIFTVWESISIQDINNIIDNLCNTKIPSIIQNNSQY